MCLPTLAIVFLLFVGDIQAKVKVCVCECPVHWTMDEWPLTFDFAATLVNGIVLRRVLGFRARSAYKLLHLGQFELQKNLGRGHFIDCVAHESQQMRNLISFAASILPVTFVQRQGRGPKSSPVNYRPLPTMRPRSRTRLNKKGTLSLP